MATVERTEFNTNIIKKLSSKKLKANEKKAAVNGLRKLQAAGQEVEGALDFYKKDPAGSSKDFGGINTFLKRHRRAPLKKNEFFALLKAANACNLFSKSKQVPLKPTRPLAAAPALPISSRPVQASPVSHASSHSLPTVSKSNLQFAKDLLHNIPSDVLMRTLTTLTAKELPYAYDRELKLRTAMRRLVEQTTPLQSQRSVLYAKLRILDSKENELTRTEGELKNIVETHTKLSDRKTGLENKAKEINEEIDGYNALMHLFTTMAAGGQLYAYPRQLQLTSKMKRLIEKMVPLQKQRSELYAKLRMLDSKADAFIRIEKTIQKIVETLSKLYDRKDVLEKGIKSITEEMNLLEYKVLTLSENSLLKGLKERAQTLRNQIRSQGELNFEPEIVIESTLTRPRSVSPSQPTQLSQTGYEPLNLQAELEKTLQEIEELQELAVSRMKKEGLDQEYLNRKNNKPKLTEEVGQVEKELSIKGKLEPLYKESDSALEAYRKGVQEWGKSVGLTEGEVNRLASNLSKAFKENVGDGKFDKLPHEDLNQNSTLKNVEEAASEVKGMMSRTEMALSRVRSVGRLFRGALLLEVGIAVVRSKEIEVEFLKQGFSKEDALIDSFYASFDYSITQWKELGKTVFSRRFWTDDLPTGLSVIGQNTISFAKQEYDELTGDSEVTHRAEALAEASLNQDPAYFFENGYKDPQAEKLVLKIIAFRSQLEALPIFRKRDR